MKHGSRARRVLSFLLSVLLVFEMLPAVDVQAAGMIDSITFDGMDHPVGLQNLDTDYTLPSGANYQKDSDYDEIIWYDKGTEWKNETPDSYNYTPSGTKLESGAKAVGGHCYTAVLHLSAADGYVFAQKGVLKYTGNTDLKKRTQGAVICTQNGTSSTSEKMALFLYFVADTSYGDVLSMADFTNAVMVGVDNFVGTLAAGESVWTLADLDFGSYIDDYFDVSLEWKEEGVVIEEDATFQEGKSYTLTISFDSNTIGEHEGRGYFVSAPDLIINDLEGFCKPLTLTNGYSGKVVFENIICTTAIDSLSITNITAPKDGGTPQKSGFSFVEYGDILSVDQVEWYHYEAEVPVAMKENELFEADEEYCMVMTLGLKDNSYIFGDIGKEEVSLSNGVISEDPVVTNEGKNLTLTIEFATEEKEIESPINISITAPEVGKIASYNADLTGTGCAIDTGDTSAKLGYIAGVQWKDISTDSEMTNAMRILDEESVFKAGHKYELYIAIKAEYGYIFGKNEYGTPNPEVYINKDKARMYNFDMNYKYIIVSCQYTMPGDYEKAVNISNVAVNVTAPVVGEYPSYYAAMNDVAGYTIDSSKNNASISNYTMNGVYWASVMSKTNTSGVVMSETKAFENGAYYLVKLYLRAKGGNGFDSTGFSVTINGFDALKYEISDDKTQLMAYYVFDALKAAELTDLSITKAPDKTVYAEGESFDPSGMMVVAGYSDHTYAEVEDYSYTPTGSLKMGNTKVVISYTHRGVTLTAEQPISVSGGGISSDDDADIWNLFTDRSEHSYKINGISSGSTVLNSNKKSSKYYDATINGNLITVKVKEGVKYATAAKAANAVLEFNLGEQGVVSYTLPVSYTKPVFKLSATTVTTPKDTDNIVSTQLLVKNAVGIFVPCDTADLDLYFCDYKIEKRWIGWIDIYVHSDVKSKLCISKDGWAEEIQLGFTVKDSRKDVIEADVSSVTVNKNAPEQVFVYEVLLNGATPEDGAITLEDKKETGLAAYADGELRIRYKDGVKKGTYTVTLKSASGSKKIKIKVSEKELNSAISLKVKSNYDVVTGQSMVIVPSLKEVSGSLDSVSVVSPEGFSAEIDNGGNIVVSYSGSTYDVKNLNIGEMKLQLGVDGIDTAIDITLKKVKAKKTALTLKAASVTVPASALSQSVLSTVNVLGTYKDKAGRIHVVAPVSVELMSKKNMSAVVNGSDISEINVTGLSANSGNAKFRVTYPGGATKFFTIKVKKGK